MKHTSMMLAGALWAAALVTLSPAEEAATPAAPVATAKAEPTLADVQRQLADAVNGLAAQIKEIQGRVDSISKFLGDRQASSMDTVDRRLRELERDIEDIDRKVDRLR